MIVKPNEKENEYKSSDKFTIEYTDGFVSMIGDKVLVTYDSLLMKVIQLKLEQQILK